MTTAIQDGMLWMNKNFGAAIEKKVKNTPISKELIIAIAMQETFYIWAKMYKSSKPKDVLRVCVGDTIDFPGRRTTWPKNRVELEAAPKGKAMFKLARGALERVARINSGYKRVVKNPNKFCHGFGIFQYDIQFFKGEDPDFFLKEKWATWDGTSRKGLIELRSAVDGLYGAGKTKLSHDESVFVAIACNRGVKGTKKDMATKRFKQGHKDSDGVYYGEHIDNYLKAMKGLW